MTQCLIWHKVCGKPMWDMAEEIDIAGEKGWITTSGHRAYPYRIIGEIEEIERLGMKPTTWADPIPDAWPDYSPEIDHSQPTVKLDIGKLLSAIVPPERGNRRL